MTLFRLALEQQPQLDRVEASGCKALRNVISNSSVLSSCYLQACPRLAVNPLHPPEPILVPSAEAGRLQVPRHSVDNFATLQSLRLQSVSLKHLDISNCGSLRELQLRMLERPIGELEAARASSKVCRRSPLQPRFNSLHPKLYISGSPALAQPSQTALRAIVVGLRHACICHIPRVHLAGPLLTWM